MLPTNIKDILDDMENILTSYQQAVSFNLRSVLRSLFWELICVFERENSDVLPTLAEHIDNIVDTIISTSEYTDYSNGGNYPVFDENKIEESIVALHNALEERGFNPMYWRMK